MKTIVIEISQYNKKETVSKTLATVKINDLGVAVYDEGITDLKQDDRERLLVAVQAILPAFLTGSRLPNMQSENVKACNCPECQALMLEFEEEASSAVKH